MITVVVGDDVARRAQAVAVERRADLAAVGEGDGGRAVPRLHQRGVIFVEGLAVLIHQLVAGPGFRDQHHHRMGQRIAARIRNSSALSKQAVSDWPS
jgi:hypothetical protein